MDKIKLIDEDAHH